MFVPFAREHAALMAASGVVAHRARDARRPDRLRSTPTRGRRTTRT